MKLICDRDCRPGAVQSVKKNGWSLISGAIVLLMPKCALCWAAYMSLLSSFGIVIKYQPWFLPVAVALFGITLVKLFISGYRQQNYLSPVLGLIAGVIIFLNRGSSGNIVMQVLGMALMAAAVILVPLLKTPLHTPTDKGSFHYTDL